MSKFTPHSFKDTSEDNNDNLVNQEINPQEPANKNLNTEKSEAQDNASSTEKGRIKNFKTYPPLIIHSNWLYSWPEMLAGFLTTLLAVKISHEHNILTLPLNLPFSETELSLPLLLLLPVYFFIRSLLKLCNIFASMDHKRLVFHKGFITLRHKMVEMETDTLQVVQVTQSPLGKLLNYGTVSVGRFSRKSLEFDIHGVKSPHLLIKKMRKKIKEARKRKSFLQNQYQGEFIEDNNEEEKEKKK